MAGKNNGTGRPLSFRCSRCRAGRIYYRRVTPSGGVQDVTLTGKKKPLNDGNANGRNSAHSRQYVCKCGHVGWSRHTDLEHKELRGK